MLDQREITKMKKGDIDKPKRWPLSVLLYALLPECDADKWTSSYQLYHWIGQFFPVIKRPMISKYSMHKVLERMALKGWIDMKKETAEPPGGGIPKKISFVKRRDMDYHGNLVWPEWLPEMQKRGKFTPDDTNNDK